MVRYLVGDIATGNRLHDLQVTEGTWSTVVGAAEDLSCTIDLADDSMRRLGIWENMRPGRTYLAALDGNNVLAAGPIWKHSYDRDASTVQLTAKGLASLLAHRVILPASALTHPVNTWWLPDSANPGQYIPNPDLTTAYTGISLGTIVTRMVQQATTWPGGALPLVYQPAQTDTNPDHARTYYGTDFKLIGDAINDIASLDDGIEVALTPRLTVDKLGIEWVLEVGTSQNPLLAATGQPVVWNVTAAKSIVSGLTMDSDASSLTSLGWGTGGQDASGAGLVARAYSSTLTDAGYPLLETVDSSHTTVTQQGTLNGWAVADLITGSSPTDTWKFTVPSHPTDDNGRITGPQLDNFRAGDFCVLHIDPFDDTTKIGDPYLIGGGDVNLRIMGLSGDDTGTKIDVTVAPAIEADITTTVQ